MLVQDVGVARLIRAICPDLPLHASTQMTLTSAECIALAESLGIDRVVLARELSVDEVPEVAFVDKNADPTFAAAVRELPPQRRMAIFLRYFADLSYAEIGAVVAGISSCLPRWHWWSS